MRNNRAKWERLLEEMRSSGKAQRVWCKEHGISYSTMRSWVRKIGTGNKNVADQNPSVVSIPKSSELNPSGWVEINNPETKSPEQNEAKEKPEKIQIQIGRISISVGEEFNQATFTKICKVLLDLC